MKGKQGFSFLYSFFHAKLSKIAGISLPKTHDKQRNLDPLHSRISPLGSRQYFAWLACGSHGLEELHPAVDVFQADL